MSEWIRNAKAGDRVVCVGLFETEDAIPSELVFEAPVVGEIYTIREIYADELGIFFRLEEIQNQIVDGEELEADWIATGFRPVQRMAPDLSVFERLLNTVPSDLEVV